MIVEHWIRPARDGGVECFLRTATGASCVDGHTQSGTPPTLEQAPSTCK